MEHLVATTVVFSEPARRHRSASRLMARKFVASTIGSSFAMVWVHSIIKESGMRVRAVGVLVAVLIGSAALPATAAPILSLSPSLASVGVGDTFTIDVNVAGVEDLYGFQFDLNFDQSLVSPLVVTEGSFLSEEFNRATAFGADADTLAGTVITVGLLLGGVPGVSGSGTLATFAFRAIGPGSAAFSLSELLLEDSIGPLQDAATLNGTSVDIKALAVPETASTASLMVMATGVAILARRRIGRSTR